MSDNYFEAQYSTWPFSIAGNVAGHDEVALCQTQLVGDCVGVWVFCSYGVIAGLTRVWWQVQLCESL